MPNSRKDTLNEMDLKKISLEEQSAKLEQSMPQSALI